MCRMRSATTRWIGSVSVLLMASSGAVWGQPIRVTGSAWQDKVVRSATRTDTSDKTPTPISRTALLRVVKDERAVDDAIGKLQAGPHDERRLIVRFKPGCDARQKAESHRRARATRTVKRMRRIPGIEVVQVPANGLARALASYTADRGAVLYAEPDYEIEPTDVPNDPLFDLLWGLRNIGQDVTGPYCFSSGTTASDIRAIKAWDHWQGDPTFRIAVLDTGVNLSHPDLIDNLWINPGEIPDNGIDDDGNGWVDDVHGYDTFNNDGDPDDDNGHGTHVAGTIGAVGNNGIGVSGVNWKCQIVALKIFSSGGSFGGSLSSAIEAVDYVIANNIPVSNNSWRTAGFGFSQALYDMIEASQSVGHLFVAAAGNDGWDNDYFQNYPSNYNLENIISVLATDNRDNRATFSNFGLTRVDIGAPGACIYSTGLDEVQYFFNAGTSMASPHAAGMVALTWSRYPELSWQRIKERVLFTARKVPALDGLIVSGGVLDAAAAVWDCNDNDIPDDDDITTGTSSDCNDNRLPDECEPDCNDNGVPDECDITSGDSIDCTGNGVPDECEPDCQSNGVADSCDIADGTSETCLGLYGNRVPDECEADCNNNGIADSCDLNAGIVDCNFNRIPDECEEGSGVDCNENGRDDICDLVFEAFFGDCNDNDILDSCETRDNPQIDCNSNGTPDECIGLEVDCNGNLIPDACDIANGTSDDANGDGFPDECDINNLGVSLVPITATGSHTIDLAANRIVLSETNQRVTFELRINGFDPSGSGLARLAAYEVGFGVAEFVNGFGEIALHRPGCTSNFDCPNWQSFCELETGLCNAMSAITFDEVRDDYIFREKLTLTTSAVDPLVRLGNVLLTPGDFVTDDGVAKYAGTVMIDVPEQVRGTYEVAFDPELVAFLTPTISNLDVPLGQPFRITILEDCNGNGTPDHVDIENGVSADCGGDGVPDECEPDCDIDTIPDTCEPDCDNDGIPDDCDDQTDCNEDGILDHCQDTSADCNTNGVWDACEVTSGISGDCNHDGVPDECPFGGVVLPSSLDGYYGVTINGIAPLDEAGHAVAGNGDINGDGFNDIVIGARFANHEESLNPGAVYVLFGQDRLDRNAVIELSDLSTVGDVRGFVIRGELEGDLAGRSVAIAGDVNGDGYDDIIIGASEAAVGDIEFAGKAYIVFGGPNVGADGLVELATLDAPLGVRFDGLAAEDLTGYEVAAIGDINHDAFADVAISAVNAANGDAFFAGAVYVIFGGNALTSAGTIDLSSFDGTRGFVVRGEQTDDVTGFAVAGVGDINDDGVDDFAIGAPLADREEMVNLGFTYVLFGAPNIGAGGEVELASLDGTSGFTIRGQIERAQVGRSISSRGDLNGDGVDDLVVAAPWTDVDEIEIAGALHVAYGNSAIGRSGTLDIQSMAESAGVVIRGQERLETIGRHVTIAGDVNGDDIDDLVIGSPFSDPQGINTGGKCYVVLGGPMLESASPLNVADISGSNGFVIAGEDAFDRLGWRVAAAGDMNGDGLDDLLVSVFAGDPDGRANAGQTLLLFSPPQGYADCNANSVWDLCDLATEADDDCDGNRMPDGCQDSTADCNDNGIWDACDVRDVTSYDFNDNDIPDECDGCVQNLDCLDENVCTYNLCDGGQCNQIDVRYGDIAPPFQGIVETADILCAVRGFGEYELCPQADVAGCAPSGVPLFSNDILAVIEAFGGADPCGCDGPAAAADAEPVIAGDMTIELKVMHAEDGLVTVEAYGHDIGEMQAYQVGLSTGLRGLSLRDVRMDTDRRDGAFAHDDVMVATDIARQRIAVVSMTRPDATARGPRYLATFVLEQTDHATKRHAFRAADVKLDVDQTRVFKSSRTRIAWKPKVEQVRSEKDSQRVSAR